jgi:hypothetical protein
MKNFYIHNGTEQQGPFDLGTLRSKNITRDTPIWYEGLSAWTTAGEIDELKEMFNEAIPPPFAEKHTPPPIDKQATRKEMKKEVSQTVAPKKNRIGRTVVIILVVLIVIFGGLVAFDNISKDTGKGTGDDTYQEKVMTVEEIERSRPTHFLTADGDYNDNFWGNKIKVHGVIKNAATVATYKDAVVRVTYYSKTKTELGSNEYTIYESFPPHSQVKFELKIDKIKDVETIGWKVIEATAE